MTACSCRKQGCGKNISENATQDCHSWLSEPLAHPAAESRQPLKQARPFRAQDAGRYGRLKLEYALVSISMQGPLMLSILEVGTFEIETMAELQPLQHDEQVRFQNGRAQTCLAEYATPLLPQTTRHPASCGISM